MTADEHLLRIRQYVYFALKSETVLTATITAHLGVDPDSVLVRGDRRSAPPVPACHMWAIECRQRGLTVDEQAARILARIRPMAALHPRAYRHGRGLGRPPGRPVPQRRGGRGGTVRPGD